MLVWRKGNINRTVSVLCYSNVQHFGNAHCTVIINSSFRLVYWIGLWSHWG